MIDYKQSKGPPTRGADWNSGKTDQSVNVFKHFEYIYWLVFLFTDLTTPGIVGCPDGG